jgi:hypothetical protein
MEEDCHLHCHFFFYECPPNMTNVTIPNRHFFFFSIKESCFLCCFEHENLRICIAGMVQGEKKKKQNRVSACVFQQHERSQFMLPDAKKKKKKKMMMMMLQWKLKKQNTWSWYERESCCLKFLRIMRNNQNLTV